MRRRRKNPRTSTWLLLGAVVAAGAVGYYGWVRVPTKGTDATTLLTQSVVPVADKPGVFSLVPITSTAAGAVPFVAWIATVPATTPVYLSADGTTLYMQPAHMNMLTNSAGSVLTNRIAVPASTNAPALLT